MIPADRSIDDAWLNDRSPFQQNFVHGLRNPVGLHIQYRLEWVEASDDDADPPGHRVVADWIPDTRHLGFPGMVHGGLLTAVLDDAMGRSTTLRRRWGVTGRLEVRFRGPAPVGESLRIEAWVTRWRRRAIAARGRMLRQQGQVIAEALGTYLPLSADLVALTTAAWPGFAAYVDTGGPDRVASDP